MESSQELTGQAYGFVRVELPFRCHGAGQISQYIPASLVGSQVTRYTTDSLSLQVVQQRPYKGRCCITWPADRASDPDLLRP